MSFFGMNGKTSNNSNNNSDDFFGINQGSSSSYQDELNNRIRNAKFRLQQSGVNPDADKRNIVEKTLNLKEDENWFFDTLDVLSRPLYGTMNTIQDNLVNKDNDNVAKDFWEGFSAKERTTGSDVLKDMGVDNKYGKAIGGFAADVALDPLTYLGVGLVDDVAKAGAKQVGKVMPENVKSGASTVKQGLDEMLGGKYNGMTESQKNMVQDIENSSRYFDDEIPRDISDVQRMYGGDGTEVGKIQEENLKWTENPTDLTNDLLNGKSARFNTVEGEFSDFLDNLQNNLKSSVSKRMDKVKANIQKANDDLREIGKKYGGFTPLRESIKNVSNRLPIGTSLDEVVKNKQTMGQFGFDESEFELLKDIRNIGRLSKKKARQAEELNKLNNPINFKNLNNGAKGVEISVSKPGVFKNALGSVDKFINDISPKTPFSEKLSKDAQERLNQLVEKDKISLYNNDPVIGELQNVLGKDLKTNRRKRTTLSLNNKKNYTKEVDDFMDANGLVTPKVIPKTMDELQHTDRLEEIDVPRPDRNASKDPVLRQAATELTRGYREMRNLAKTYNLSIEDIQGYMKHILSRESEEYLNKENKANIGKAPVGGSKPTVRRRGYEGSALDINERMGVNVIDPDAYFSSALGRKKLSQYIHAEALKKQILSKYGREYQPGMNVGKDEVIIKPDQYVFFKTDGGQLAAKKGTEYVVPKPLARTLDNWNKKLSNDEGLNKFSKAMSSLNDLWKRLALFSPSFHIRNLIGSNFNMWVAGVNPKDLVKYHAQAYDDIRIAKELLERKNKYKVNSGNLTKKEREALKFFQEYRKQGLNSSSMFDNEFRFEDERKALEDRLAYDQKSTLGKATQRAKRPFQSSRDLGMGMDRLSRYALYKWARQKGKSVKEADELVRKTLFDYSDLSNLEKNIRQVIPFYTWMRKNIPFQLKNLMLQPGKYLGVEKARQAGLEATGNEEESMPEWMRESLAIPVGEDKFLAANLPVSDLTQLSDPIGMAVNATTPYLKLPFEMTANRNMYFDSPIEEFEGQTDKALGIEMGAKPAYALNSLLGNIGTVTRKAAENEDFSAWNDIALGGIFKENNPERQQYFNTSDELQRLQDMMKSYKQNNGQRPPTLRELEEMGLQIPWKN